LVLSAALTTAALVNAAEVPVKSAGDTTCQTAKVVALFDVAPLSVTARAKLVQADPALLQADVNSLFDVAPLSVSSRSKLVMADAALLQADVNALFDVAPVSVRK